jgi:hypothetical protein
VIRLLLLYPIWVFRGGLDAYGQVREYVHRIERGKANNGYIWIKIQRNSYIYVDLWGVECHNCIYKNPVWKLRILMIDYDAAGWRIECFSKNAKLTWDMVVDIMRG